MAFSTRSRTAGFSYSGSLPRGVKWLLIINVVLYLVYFFAVRAGVDWPFEALKLVPGEVLRHFAIWQLGTYMFLHDPGGVSHILFNMLTLWMFGSSLERTWGTRLFLRYYLYCGLAAGVCVVVLNALFGRLDVATIGASGAIYGLLLAFGVLFSEQVVMFGFLFPIKAKYFVMIIGAIEFLYSFGPSGGGVSHIAHLGGMLFGYLYLKRMNLNLAFARSLQEQYKQWKLQRAKRKFEVYLRKHDSGRGPWVN